MKTKIFRCLLRIFGIGCILWALIIVQGFNKDETIAKEASVKISKKFENAQAVKPIASEDYSMPVREIDGVDYIGQIRIPSKKILLPIAANYSFEQMSETPTLYKGSYYNNDIVICAHNYEYHFRPLMDIEIGDVVEIETVDGKVIKYIITNREIIQPTSVESVDKIEGKDDWDLTLFTCTPSGLQRVLIRCVRV